MSKNINGHDGSDRSANQNRSVGKARFERVSEMAKVASFGAKSLIHRTADPSTKAFAGIGAASMAGMAATGAPVASLAGAALLTGMSTGAGAYVAYKDAKEKNK